MSWEANPLYEKHDVGPLTTRGLVGWSLLLVAITVWQLVEGNLIIALLAGVGGAAGLVYRLHRHGKT
jgi:hypothetical protein